MFLSDLNHIHDKTWHPEATYTVTKIFATDVIYPVIITTVIFSLPSFHIIRCYYLDETKFPQAEAEKAIKTDEAL